MSRHGEGHPRTGRRPVGGDSAPVVVVVPGELVAAGALPRAPTPFSRHDAATLSRAATEDTVRAVRASRASGRLLVGVQPTSGGSHGFEVIPDRSAAPGDRLTAALGEGIERDHGPAGVLLIGTSTPQVTPELLDDDWRGADAVLGLSEEGGFWAIGLRGVDPARVFGGEPMPSQRAGAASLARLLDLGLSVRLLTPLRDVSHPTGAAAVATRHPGLGFSARYRKLIGGQPCELSAEHLFDRAFAGAATAVTSAIDVLGLDLARWSGQADDVDLMVVSRCRPPVVDLGCGPGRMVIALSRTGRSALGVDISAVAVATSLSRGGPALHRRVDDRLPAEGRWGTALLIDTNIGIGGDVAALLRRCSALVEPTGLIICEVDPAPNRHDVHQVIMAVDGIRSRPLPWSRIGAVALARVAVGLQLRVVEEWTAGARVFVVLRRDR